MSWGSYTERKIQQHTAGNFEYQSESSRIIICLHATHLNLEICNRQVSEFNFQSIAAQKVVRVITFAGNLFGYYARRNTYFLKYLACSIFAMSTTRKITNLVRREDRLSRRLFPRSEILKKKPMTCVFLPDDFYLTINWRDKFAISYVADFPRDFAPLSKHMVKTSNCSSSLTFTRASSRFVRRILFRSLSYDRVDILRSVDIPSCFPDVYPASVVTSAPALSAAS